LLAQTDSKPGYVITNKNYTLHGLVDYRGDAKNSQICVYKENETSDSKEYLPGQIKAYRFLESKYYVSKNIPENGTKKNMFLEFLVNGIADLYYYRDINNNPHFFIEKRDGQLFELKNTQEMIKNNDSPYYWERREYLLEKKEYIGLLKYAFADCPQLFESINNATLDTKSLINITKKYHNHVCNGEKCIIYEKKLPAIKLTFAPFASMNVSYLNIVGGHEQYENIKFQNSTYPAIGVLVNTTMPRENEKLSLQVSADIGKNYFYGTGTYVQDNSFNEVHLHSTILKAKGGFKYTYPTGKFRPTIMAGANFTTLFDVKGRRVEEVNRNGMISTFEYATDVLGSNNIGFNLDLGVDYHKLGPFTPFIDVSFSSSSGSKGQGQYPINTKLKTISINAGFYF
jgi:outer membrane protein W